MLICLSDSQYLSFLSLNSTWKAWFSLFLKYTSFRFLNPKYVFQAPTLPNIFKIWVPHLLKGGNTLQYQYIHIFVAITVSTGWIFTIFLFLCNQHRWAHQIIDLLNKQQMSTQPHLLSICVWCTKYHSEENTLFNDCAWVLHENLSFAI